MLVVRLPKSREQGITTPGLASFIVTALHGLSRDFFDSLYSEGWEQFSAVWQTLGSRLDRLPTD
jgi:hypothetical protein